MTSILINLDTITQTNINDISKYKELKIKIEEREEQLKKLKEELAYLISSSNFKYVNDDGIFEKAKNYSFLKIKSFTDLAFWIKGNKETEEFKAFENVMNTLGNYSPLKISNSIHKRFVLSDAVSFNLPNKITNIFNIYKNRDDVYYTIGDDKSVEFLFSNIYVILDVIFENNS